MWIWQRLVFMASGLVLAFVFRAGLGIWARWGSSILQARFPQSLSGSIQPKSLSQTVSRVYCLTHTSASACVVGRLLIERNLDAQRSLQWPGGNPSSRTLPETAERNTATWAVVWQSTFQHYTLNKTLISPSVFVFYCRKLKWNCFFWSDAAAWISFISFWNNNQSAVNALRHCAECKKNHSFRSERDFVASNSPSADV